MARLANARSTYNLGGLAVPTDYTIMRYRPRATGPVGAPTTANFGPYAPQAGRRAFIEIEVLSATLANYDGKSFQFTYPLESSPIATGTHGWTFDDDAPPPSTGSLINIQGLTTTAQIAAQMVAAINLATLSIPQQFAAVVPGDPSIFRVYAPVPGVRGNQVVVIGGGFDGLLRINDVTSFTAFAPLFHNGADFTVPIRWGKNFGFGPSNGDTPTSAIIPG